MEKTISATAECGSFHSMLQAFEILGLTHLIGKEGEYTAFTSENDGDVTVHIIPGRFSSDEFLDMVSLLTVPVVSDHAYEPDLEMLVAA